MLREAATEITRTLQAAGYLAFFVGGCVRDTLLGLTPKDFDVATAATPAQILALFPRALPIGASFGVMQIDGVEVATFRSEHSYADGRRPEHVAYETDPRLDASRRDFTINAMFFDPVAGVLHDFLGGREDLDAGIIRAIGNPRERFAEDHLRMLRAVRFAARFGYTIEAETFAAMQALHGELARISVERVREEMTLILTGNRPCHALRLLQQSKLLPIADTVIEIFGALKKPIPATLGWAALLYPDAPLYRYKFSRDDTVRIRAILASQPKFRTFTSMGKADRKRFLRQDHFEDHLNLQRAVSIATKQSLADYDFAKAELERTTPAQLRPPALIGGEDLITLGLPPGPKFTYVLSRVEEAQLDETVYTREQAMALVATLLA